MLLRLAGYACLGAFSLYLAEGVGLVAERRFFPDLPRLESPLTPGKLLASARWGAATASCLSDGTSFSTCTGSAQRAGYAPTTAPSGGSFTTRWSERSGDLTAF
jgi:hypothetical protein